MSTDSLGTGWYYAKGDAPSGGPPGQQVGPFAWEDLYLRGQAGELHPDDLVWNPALLDWVRAGQVPGLLAPTASHATPPIIATQAAATPSGGRRSWLLPVLIPLIALVVARAGL